MYGVVVAALGMLSTIATDLAIDAYGPISDNAGSLSLSTATTIGGAPNTVAPCAPAWCGDLAISYPFWLAGTHLPKCGYDQGFKVTCDKAKDDGTCNIDKFVNASFVPSPPFEIEPQQNQELFFVYDCNLRAPQLPRSWTPLRCGNNGSFTWLSGEYRPEDSSMAMPGNCNVAMIPVVAYEGATAADYQWFVEGGFFLSYYLTDTEDDDYYDQCQACSYRAGHGQCRTIVSDNGFQCYCSDGVYSTTACGTKRANWKTTIVVESKRELNQECSIYIGLSCMEAITESRILYLYRSQPF
uniref:H(+)-exporting diphosphatase n=2 Tax=Zea mays TaxID=4577 RepID=A0A804MNF6_MAIZE